jgi:hypothetical protein
MLLKSHRSPSADCGIISKKIGIKILPRIYLNNLTYEEGKQYSRLVNL